MRVASTHNHNHNVSPTRSSRAVDIGLTRHILAHTHTHTHANYPSEVTRDYIFIYWRTPFAVRRERNMINPSANPCAMCVGLRLNEVHAGGSLSTSPRINPPTRPQVPGRVWAHCSRREASAFRGCQRCRRRYATTLVVPVSANVCARVCVCKAIPVYKI